MIVPSRRALLPAALSRAAVVFGFKLSGRGPDPCYTTQATRTGRHLLDRRVQWPRCFIYYASWHDPRFGRCATFGIINLSLLPGVVGTVIYFAIYFFNGRHAGSRLCLVFVGLTNGQGSRGRSSASGRRCVRLFRSRGLPAAAATPPCPAVRTRSVSSKATARRRKKPRRRRATGNSPAHAASSSGRQPHKNLDSSPRRAPSSARRGSRDPREPREPREPWYCTVIPNAPIIDLLPNARRRARPAGLHFYWSLLKRSSTQFVPGSKIKFHQRAAIFIRRDLRLFATLPPHPMAMGLPAFR